MGQKQIQSFLCLRGNWAEASIVKTTEQGRGSCGLCYLTISVWNQTCTLLSVDKCVYGCINFSIPVKHQSEHTVSTWCTLSCCTCCSILLYTSCRGLCLYFAFSLFYSIFYHFPWSTFNSYVVYKTIKPEILLVAVSLRQSCTAARQRLYHIIFWAWWSQTKLAHLQIVSGHQSLA